MKTTSLIIVLALSLAACGDAGTPATSTSDPGSGPIGAACPMENPNCEDTPDTPTAPPLDNGPSTGLVVDGGLTVAEALTTEATGPLAVKGFLFNDGAGWRLCEVLAESFPPQCGGAVLNLADFTDELASEYAEAIQESQGTQWTDAVVTLLGDLQDESLLVNPLIQG